MDNRQVQSLPIEVLEVIFSHLEQREIVSSVLPVCRRWQAIALSQVLSKHLEFCGRDVPTEEALRLIKAIPNLQSLQLSVRSDATELMQAVASVCPDLRRLAVEWCDVPRLSLNDALVAVFRNCQRLTDLNITAVDVASSLQLCQQLGTTRPNLQRLTIECQWFGPAQLDAVIDSFPHIHSFEASLRSCSEANVARLVQRWGQSLEVLSLKMRSVSDAGVAPLANCLQLRKLCLLRLRSPGAVLQQLADLEQLEDLDLSGSACAVDHWQHFFSQSRSAGRLRRIKLAHCFSVDDSVCAAIAATCHSLTDLDVSYCDAITASGLKEVLQCCRRLMWLSILLTHESVMPILFHLPELAPQLRQVWIFGSLLRILGEPTLEQIRADMPALEILST